MNKLLAAILIIIVFLFILLGCDYLYYKISCEDSNECKKSCGCEVIAEYNLIIPVENLSSELSNIIQEIKTNGSLKNEI